MNNDFLWVEKYRPKTIDECILPDATKQTFKDFLDKGEVPNLLLAGPPGVGKTTVAKALCHELGVDYYVINGSDEGRFLDTVRNQPRTLLRPFRFRQMLDTKSSSSMKQITQGTTYNSSYGQILRRFITTVGSFSHVTTKIRSLNPSTRDVPLSSLESKEEEKAQIAAGFFGRLKQILDTEGIEYDNKVLVELINKHFPDWRRVLNECQRYSTSGKIDSAILATFSDVSVNDLIKNLKQKNFTEVRKWVVNNLDNDSGVLLRRIYDALLTSLENNSIPAAVLIVAKYQYQIAFVADQEINFLAALTEIMCECEFK